MSEFISVTGQYAVLILPWFIVGIFLSFLVETYVHPQYLKKFSGRINYQKLILSQILGMISPLSILSFLPVANELTGRGVNPGLLLSFFIAERAYDLQSFFITSGLFGIKFALLNALVIFVSLIVSALSIKNDRVKFIKKQKGTANHFWLRQGKLLGIVIVGIGIGALIRILVPEQWVSELAGSRGNGFVTALLLGFTIYLGPIAANYPVAKAFSDLGMSQAGVFAFLTISPIFNFVVIALFAVAVGLKHSLKPIVVYVVTSILLSLLCSFFL